MPIENECEETNSPANQPTVRLHPFGEVHKSPINQTSTTQALIKAKGEM